MAQGIRPIARTHGKDYNYREAQRRLDEHVAPFNSQVINALHVDSVEIKYYQGVHSGIPCSCEKGDNVSVTNEDSGTINYTIGKSSGKSIAENANFEVVDAASINSMFGDNGTNLETDDEYEDASDEFTPIDNYDNSGNVEHYNGEDSLFAGRNVNCGLCGRTGYIPGYTMLRGMRTLFSHRDVVESVGYNIDSSSFPYKIDRLSNVGYVTFALLVPKYYVAATFSIRDNLIIKRDFILFNNVPLTDAMLRANLGATIMIQIKSDSFTHVVIEFEFDTKIIHANIPNISRTLDYTMLETIGNLNVVLPPNICTVTAGDIIAIPKRNLQLKVVDISYTQTAKMKHIEWTASCRVLQPQENLRKMNFGYPIT